MERAFGSAATSQLGAFGGAFQALGPEALAAGAGIAAAVAAATGLITATQHAVDYGASIEKLSKTTGLSTTFLQEFQYAAGASDIEVGVADAAIKSLNDSLGAVNQKLPRSKQLLLDFSRLGFTKEQLAGFHDAGELFPILAQRMANMQDVAGREAIAKKLGLEELLPLLEGGATGFDTLAAKAEHLNLIMSPEEVNAAADAKRTLEELNEEMADKANISFANFAGTLIAIKEGFVNAESAGLHFLGALTNTLSPLQKIKDLQGEYNDLQAQDRATGKIAPSHVALYQQITAEAQAATTVLQAQNRLAAAVGGPPAAPVGIGTGDKGRKGRTPRAEDDQVQVWSEQLHAQEAASKDFFGDETSMELAYWQEKLAIVQAEAPKSKAAVAAQLKDELAISSKIYDDQKALARQAYDEHLADLNAQLEADRDSWAKEQADWETKLAYIEAHFHKESTQYQDAFRQFEAAEREHQQRMLEEMATGGQKGLDELQRSLESQQAIREDNARTALAVSGGKNKYAPLGGVLQAQAEAAIDHQLAQQKIADLDAQQAHSDAVWNHELDIVATVSGAESQLYAKLTQQKKDADQGWANKKLQLLNQLTNQEVQDQLKVQQAWHAVIDPMVQSTGSNMLKLAEGTETWNQALLNVGQSALDMIIQQIERMVEAWIVSALTGTAKNAGLAGSAGVASMAGAPFPIDLTAPAFGAEMAAAAGAFGSFAQGINVVPRDMVAQIHAGERIMSPGDNSALISAMRGRGPGGGDVHNYHTTYAPQVQPKADFKEDLWANANDVYALVKRGIRDGKLSVG